MATDIDELQRSLNRFRKKYLLRVAPLKVDGEKGHATNRAVRDAKFFLGYGDDRDAKVTQKFIRRLRHPRSTEYMPRSMVWTGIRRRAKQKREMARQLAKRHVTRGVSSFDGRPVAAWLKPYLEWARANGWHGTLNSGWRDPKYSEGLCLQMCGRTSCPGRCAGRASNHSGSNKPLGAIDVSDYGTFGSLMRRAPYQPHIFNALGAQDPVHYSASGR